MNLKKETKMRKVADGIKFGTKMLSQCPFCNYINDEAESGGRCGHFLAIYPQSREFVFEG